MTPARDQLQVIFDAVDKTEPGSHDDTIFMGGRRNSEAADALDKLNLRHTKSCRCAASEQTACSDRTAGDTMPATSVAETS